MTGGGLLNKYPVLYGYSLVVPKAHKEQVTGDFSQEEYLRLQALIYAVRRSHQKICAARTGLHSFFRQPAGEPPRPLARCPFRPPVFPLTNNS